jgi:hypothetical protein
MVKSTYYVASHFEISLEPCYFLSLCSTSQLPISKFNAEAENLGVKRERLASVNICLLHLQLMSLATKSAAETNNDVVFTLNVSI